MNGKNRNFYVGLAIICFAVIILLKIFNAFSMLLGKIILGFAVAFFVSSVSKIIRKK
ncbi:MAG: hypothetical protein U0O22_00370 [Acutalibacteraceae bacterium]